MFRPSQASLRVRVALWLACSAGFAGCNGVLGIRAPADAILVANDGGAIVLRDAGRVLDASSRASGDDGRVLGDERDGGFPGIQFDGGAVRPSEDPRWASWPMPNPTSVGLGRGQSYVATSDDLVTDQVTHLEWQRNVDDRMYDFDAATSYCASIDLPGGEFRLPSRIELLSLLDFTAESPAIDNDAFPETPADYYWSSSSFVGSPQSLWVVNFGSGAGFVSSSDRTSSYHVRCVR